MNFITRLVTTAFIIPLSFGSPASALEHGSVGTIEGICENGDWGGHIGGGALFLLEGGSVVLEKRGKIKEGIWTKVGSETVAVNILGHKFTLTPSC